MARTKSGFIAASAKAKAAAAKKSKATKAKKAKATAGKKATSQAHAPAGRQTKQNTTQSPSKADVLPNAASSPTLRRSRRGAKQKDCFSGAEPKSYISTSIEEDDADADMETKERTSGDERERSSDKEENIVDRTIKKRKSRAREPSATSSSTHTGSHAQASNTTYSTEDREHAIKLAIQSVLKKEKIDPTFISGIGYM